MKTKTTKPVKINFKSQADITKENRSIRESFMRRELKPMIKHHIAEAYIHIQKANELIQQLENDQKSDSALKLFFRDHVEAHKTYVDWTEDFK